MNITFQNCRSGQGLQRAAQDQAAFLKSLANLRPEDCSLDTTRFDVFERGEQVTGKFRATPEWPSGGLPDFSGQYLTARPDGTATAGSLRTNGNQSTVQEYTRWADGTIEGFQYTNHNGKLEVQELPILGPGEPRLLGYARNELSRQWDSFQNLSQEPPNPGIGYI